MAEVFMQIKNLKQIFLLILTFYIIHCTFYIAHATVRYVSTTGSSTPPYTSWTTAADSIQKCINICVFGDTIYVANGIYQEEITMIRGLSLIGSGIDSCIIDTRSLELTFAVTVRDSCLFKNFKVIVSNYNNQTHQWDGIGVIIYEEGSSPNYLSIVEMNDIENAFYGISSSTSNTLIQKNNIVDCDIGITLASVNQEIINRVIDNHIISGGLSIDLNFGGTLYIANNICFGKGCFKGSYSGLNEIYNNLFINRWGRAVALSDNTLFYNNVITGSSNEAILVGNDNQVVKNNVIEDAEVGITTNVSENPVIQYNNFWNLGVVNENIVYPDSTNLFQDPMFVNDDSTQGEIDFHLQMFSPLIDTGDPDILDIDGTRSDIGLYGGPLGEMYTYQDLAPRAPRNLTAEVDSEYITISWNPNTEADFNSYFLYRDTTANFTADTTTFVLELTDTFYVQIIPPGINAFYYKLTAKDNQGNTSQPSEELPVNITSVSYYPTTISDYRLYQNYPNPFNPSTKIGYKLKERSYVKLYVYDIKGELVSILVNNVQEAGYYEVEFSGETKDEKRETLVEKLASGIYIYQIMVKNENNIPMFMDSKKMLMIK
jgi:hypothetical protein